MGPEQQLLFFAGLFGGIVFFVTVFLIFKRSIKDSGLATIVLGAIGIFFCLPFGFTGMAYSFGAVGIIATGVITFIIGLANTKQINRK
ncbi:hypothetical protein [Priestia megaterium]|uniref:Uncharacterized protein n=1 Tax=Priestia megaterium TaxID=1404 RepID=A0A6M6E731_PRIMG|nr:hypothetical protein [Priestia megaterium]QJX80358.1 hypothetical protein FDZ14_30185 [Priestia megaterium]